MKKKDNHKENESTISQNIKKIAIVGLPNTGKSQIFNFLTGEYTIVANYPLTTVEIKETRCKIGDQSYKVFDTPGLHSIYIHSEEELVVRDMLFSEKPEIIIQSINANQVKQSLALTADLLELGIPMIISLNAIDETVQRGIKINAQTLSQKLGIPVIKIRSLQDRGTEKLKMAIGKANAIKDSITYIEKIEKGIATIESELPDSIFCKRKVSILLLENDSYIFNTLQRELKQETFPELKDKIETIHNSFSSNIGREINNNRNNWIDTIYEQIVTRQHKKRNEFLKVFAQLSRHPIFGIPILIFFIALTYLLVVHVAGFLGGQINTYFVDPIVAYLSELIPLQWLNEFLVGDYGVLTLGLFNAFCTVLPILSVFFLMFAALEDIGYIPNLCVLTNRLFKKIGITGKSIMSLVLGFGCKTMATLTTRGLQSRKEKYIAIYLIAFAIPCSAQLGLNMAILGRVGVKAFILAFGALAFVEILAGTVLNKILKEDQESDFIQELPPIRIPNLKAIIVKTYYRLAWFLKEAVPIFIIAAIVLFLFDKSGGLDLLKKVLSPLVINWLGLPLDMVDALILTMARHEAAAGLILKMVTAGSLTYMQSIIAVVITTMFVPCFANIVAMCKELGTKTGIGMAIIINISSFFLAGILHWILVLIL